MIPLYFFLQVSGRKGVATIRCRRRDEPEGSMYLVIGPTNQTEAYDTVESAVQTAVEWVDDMPGMIDWRIGKALEHGEDPV